MLHIYCRGVKTTFETGLIFCRTAPLLHDRMTLTVCLLYVKKNVADDNTDAARSSLHHFITAVGFYTAYAFASASVTCHISALVGNQILPSCIFAFIDIGYWSVCSRVVRYFYFLYRPRPILEMKLVAVRFLLSEFPPSNELHGTTDL